MGGYNRNVVVDQKLQRAAQPGDGWGVNPRLSTKTDAALTLTVADILGGVIQGPASVARNYTSPTAALLDAALPEMSIDDVFVFWLSSSGAGAITLVGGTGVTVAGNAAAPATGSRMFMLRKTAASGAYTATGI